jgi:hypothetical protein
MAARQGLGRLNSQSGCKEIGQAVTVQLYPAGRSPVLGIIETQQVHKINLGEFSFVSPRPRDAFRVLVMRPFGGSYVQIYLLLHTADIKRCLSQAGQGVPKTFFGLPKAVTC